MKKRGNSVYPVREDTILVKRNLQEIELKGKKVLEIGTGNGELALTAAKKEAKVTATDINSKAIHHTQKRFKEKNLDAEIYESDLFQNIEDKFDLIIFNPPYLKGKKGIGDEAMWRGGKTGLEVVKSFITQSRGYCRKNGRVWTVLSSATNYQEFIHNHDLSILDDKKLWFEKIFLVKLE